MRFTLGIDNLISYLNGQNLKGYENSNSTQVQPKLCKNFNLIVEFSDRPPLLVKQESLNAQGQINGDLLSEWQVHQLIRSQPDVSHLQSLVSQAISFDVQNSILILRYLTHYNDLDSVYRELCDYPPAIADHLGTTLAEFHRSTLDHPDVKMFLLGRDAAAGSVDEWVPNFTKALEEITPETFGQVTTDGLKFYELVQRYESLGRAIAHLNTLYQPCCLIHSDLKFSNVLLHDHWHLAVEPTFHPQSIGDDVSIRLIDWEKWRWGDPAFDLGSLLSEYLKRWLKSLMASQDVPIELALQLATTPLEQMQPSMTSLIRAYLQHFPGVLERFPDFLSRVMCFAGWALMESIQAHIHYYEPFGNTGICMLQVAKTLLCSPAASIQTVLGVDARDLLEPCPGVSPSYVCI